MFGFGAYFDHAANHTAQVPDTVATLNADLARASASPQVGRVAQWAVLTGDHSGLPFVVVDKSRARLFAFDPQGRLRGSTPILRSASGRQERNAASMPEGRFVADSWLSVRSDGIVWVNADTTVSLHGLSSSQASEATPNVPAAPDANATAQAALHVEDGFYRNYLSPLRSQGSVAYVLHEDPSAQEMFGRWEMEGWLGAFAQSPRGPTIRRPS